MGVQTVGSERHGALPGDALPLVFAHLQRVPE